MTQEKIIQSGDKKSDGQLFWLTAWLTDCSEVGGSYPILGKSPSRERDCGAGKIEETLRGGGTKPEEGGRVCSDADGHHSVADGSSPGKEASGRRHIWVERWTDWRKFSVESWPTALSESENLVNYPFLTENYCPSPVRKLIIRLICFE